MADRLLTVTNDVGRSFNVRVVRQGDAYGLDDRLTHDDPRPMIEWYDATHANDGRFGERGQFVSRYYVSSLAERDVDQGLNLDGGVDAWCVTAENVAAALRFANAPTRCRVCETTVWPNRVAFGDSGRDRLHDVCQHAVEIGLSVLRAFGLGGGAFGRCAVCGDAITADESALLDEDRDFVEHGDRGHLIRRLSSK